jgi:GDP-L-fucose synthase
MRSVTATGRIYVAGHRGLVGSAIVRRLRSAGHTDILVRTRAELDLRDARAVDAFFEAERPAQVYLAAARVGGILANSREPAAFLRDNLLIAVNVLDAAHRLGVEKLQFLGSSCIYPRLAPQPIPESALMTGPLEPTNAAYAIAKIAGIELCRAYRAQHGLAATSLMPTNLYGPGDDFDLERSHVIPALIRKFHEGHSRGDADVVIWGTGTPRREFLHVDDLADACVFCMERYDGADPINVGVGQDVSIADLAGLVADIVGFRGRIVYDASKPDGTPRKLLDVSRLRALGWAPRLGLREGLERTHAWFVEHVAGRADQNTRSGT